MENHPFHDLERREQADEYWEWIGDVLEFVARKIPPGENPQKIYWDHPDEEYKNEMEAAALEREVLFETREAIEYVLTHTRTPKCSDAAAWYAQCRLKFAQAQAKVFSTKSSRLMHTVIRPTREANHLEVIHWLIFDLYDR